MKKVDFVCILSNKYHSVLYVGVTSNLVNRVNQHKIRFYKNAFTSRYNVTELVYFEEFESIVDAIGREKQLKAGSWEKKSRLISEFNPKWEEIALN